MRRPPGAAVPAVPARRWPQATTQAARRRPAAPARGAPRLRPRRAARQSLIGWPPSTAKLAPGKGSKARTRRSITAAGACQSIGRFGLVDLVRVGHALGRLRPGLQRALRQQRQRLQRSAARPARPGGRAGCALVSSGAMGSASRQQHGAGVQAGVHLHDGDAGLRRRRPRWRAGSARRRASAAAASRGYSGSPGAAAPAPTAAGSARRRPPPCTSGAASRQRACARPPRPRGTCRPAAGCAAAPPAGRAPARTA